MKCKKTTTKLLRQVLGLIYKRKDVTVTDLYKQTTITHSHLYNILVNLDTDGIVTTVKVGRSNLINITERGTEPLKCLRKLDRIYARIL